MSGPYSFHMHVLASSQCCGPAALSTCSTLSMRTLEKPNSEPVVCRYGDAWMVKAVQLHEWPALLLSDPEEAYNLLQAREGFAAFMA